MGPKIAISGILICLFSLVFSFGGVHAMEFHVTNTTELQNALTTAQSNVTIDYVKVSPFAVFRDEIPGATVTIEAYATGEGFQLYVSYFVGWFDGVNPQCPEVPMFDDGSHGDRVAGDDVWTTTIELNMSIPKLRLYNNSVDYFKLWVLARDTSGGYISPQNPICADLPVGIIERSNAAHTSMISSTILATAFAANIKTEFLSSSDIHMVTKEFYRSFSDNFDVLVIFTDGRTTDDGIPGAFNVRNDVQGINMSLFDSSHTYGSSGRLQLIINIDNNVIATSFLHELGHRFAYFLNDPRLDLTKPGGGGIHHGTSDIIGQMKGGYYLQDNGDGTFTLTNPDGPSISQSDHRRYADIELYLMGLLSWEDVRPHRFLKDRTFQPPFLSVIPAESTEIITIDDVIEVYGSRIPSYNESQKHFNAAFIVASHEFINDAEISLINTIAEYYSSNSSGDGLVPGGLFEAADPPSFCAATNFRATMSTSLFEFIATPVPDIKINGSDGPITVSSGTPVSITVSLNPGNLAGQNADWWIAVNTPFAPPLDWYTYVYPTGWLPGINLCVQTGPFDLSAYEVLNMTLPVGDYTFYFALDDPDGAATGPWWGLDSVSVTVNEKSSHFFGNIGIFNSSDNEKYLDVFVNIYYPDLSYYEPFGCVDYGGVEAVRQCKALVNFYVRFILDTGLYLALDSVIINNGLQLSNGDVGYQVIKREDNLSSIQDLIAHGVNREDVFFVKMGEDWGHYGIIHDVDANANKIYVLDANVNFDGKIQIHELNPNWVPNMDVNRF